MEALTVPERPSPSADGGRPTVPRARPGGTPKRKSGIGRYFLAALGLIVVVGALAGIKASQIGKLIGFGAEMQKAGPPPEVVSTVPVKEQHWEGELRAVASVVSAKGVSLANDAAGVVARIHFDSGVTVKRGQILVELDSKVERAQLASTLARRELARTQLQRSQALVSAGAISQAQVDADDASYKSLSADVGALQAQIDRKLIRAPFGGKVGLRAVNLGQYLAPGTTVAELESTDAMFIDFTLPQRNLAELKVGMPVRARQEGSDAHGVEGTISAIEPSIDSVTRAVKVRATFPDQAGFSPGMFVRISVILPEKSQVIAIPQTAVVHASYGDSVFVLEEAKGPDGKPRRVARQHFVKLGEARGDFVAVLDGVKAGQELVAAGAFKLRNGTAVIVDNDAVKVDPQLAPRPENR